MNESRDQSPQDPDTSPDSDVVPPFLFFVAALLLFFGFVFFFLQPAMDEHQTAWREKEEGLVEHVRGLAAPTTVRVSLERCIADKSWGRRYSLRNGGNLFLHYFADPDPEMLASMADEFLTECAESFVLDGGTVADMEARARMLAPHLSDAFRNGELAVAMSGMSA